MKGSTLVRRKSLSVVLVLTLVAGLLVIPVTEARAGILGSFLSAVRPIAGIAGKIGGAVLGASLCAGFVPPLGMIAGGVAGWIAGGIITGYGTGSLKNLATLAGGVAGAMALGPGAVGIVGGFLLGGFLGRTAMGLLQKGDKDITGGILLRSSGSGSSTAFSASGASSQLVPTSDAAIPAAAQPSGLTPSAELQNAEARYQKAYQAYLEATRESDAAKLQAADAEYKAAFSAYKELTGNAPK